jgi:hypothetical protein
MSTSLYSADCKEQVVENQSVTLHLTSESSSPTQSVDLIKKGLPAARLPR